MKKFLYIITFLILILVVLAEEVELKKVFDDGVTSDEFFTADDKQWYIHAFSKLKARLDYPGGTSKLINIGECNDQEGYRVCLWAIISGENVNFTSSSDVEKFFNITTQQWTLFPQLTIHLLDATKMELEREFDKTEIVLGEKIKVTVEVTNNDYLQKDASYEEVFPENIDIIEVSGCELDEKTVSWSGRPVKDVQSIFYYTFEPRTYMNYTSKGILKYESETVEDKEDIEIIVAPLQVITELNSSNVKLDEEIEAIVNIKNINDDFDILPLTYKITFPPGLKIIRKSGPADHLNTYFVHNKGLEINENRTFKFVFKAQTSGKYKITEDITYTINKVTRNFKKATNLNVEAKPLNVVLTRKELTPGSTTDVPVKIANPNEWKYLGVKVSIETNLPVQETEAIIDELKGHETKEVFNLPITIPKSDDEFYMNVLVSGRTQYGEVIKKEESLKIATKVAPVEEPVIEKPKEEPVVVTPPEPVVDEVDIVSYAKYFFIVGAAIGFAGLLIFLIFFRKKKNIEDKLEELEREEAGSALKKTKKRKKEKVIEEDSDEEENTERKMMA